MPRVRPPALPSARSPNGSSCGTVPSHRSCVETQAASWRDDSCRRAVIPACCRRAASSSPKRRAAGGEPLDLGDDRALGLRRVVGVAARHRGDVAGVAVGDEDGRDAVGEPPLGPQPPVQPRPRPVGEDDLRQPERRQASGRASPPNRQPTATCSRSERRSTWRRPGARQPRARSARRRGLARTAARAARRARRPRRPTRSRPRRARTSGRRSASGRPRGRRPSAPPRRRRCRGSGGPAGACRRTAPRPAAARSAAAPRPRARSRAARRRARAARSVGDGTAPSTRRERGERELEVVRQHDDVDRELLARRRRAHLAAGRLDGVPRLGARARAEQQVLEHVRRARRRGRRAPRSRPSAAGRRRVRGAPGRPCAGPT